jgi:predicted DCC family thiol-disulfide oxidoreductase YuxK
MEGEPSSVRRRAPGAQPWAVLYDGDCGLCMWLLAGLLRWDRASLLDPIALQRPQAEALVADLPREERMASWHLVSPAGDRRSGGAALPTLLRLLPAGQIPAVAFARLPSLTDRAYRWVAAHRTELSRWVPAQSKRRAAERVRLREREL